MSHFIGNFYGHIDVFIVYRDTKEERFEVLDNQIL